MIVIENTFFFFFFFHIGTCIFSPSCKLDFGDILSPSTATAAATVAAATAVTSIPFSCYCPHYG